MFVAKNNWFSVDLAKYILAILIVSMHTHAFGEWDVLQNILDTRIYPILVPLFFVFSGFFYMSSDGEMSWSYCFKKIKRVLILYLVWLIPNLPTVYLHFRGTSLGFILSSVCFSSSYMGSWYLNALMWCMLILTLLHHISKRYFLMLLILLGTYFVAICQGFISDSLGLLVIFTSYSFLSGLLLFSLGALIRIKHIPRIVMAGGLVGTLLTIVFGKSLFVPQILLVFFLGGILLTYSPSGSVSAGKILRNASTILYLGHPAYSIFLRHYVFSNQLVVFVTVIVTLTTFSYLVYRYEKVFPSLKYLH